MKRLIAMLLLVCMLAAYLAVGAMAAGIMPRYVRPVICISGGTNFRKSPSTDSISHGHFSYGDQMMTGTDPGVEWFYGYPGTQTALYQQFGLLWGYSVSRAFSEIE